MSLFQDEESQEGTGKAWCDVLTSPATNDAITPELFNDYATHVGGVASKLFLVPSPSPLSKVLLASTFACVKALNIEVEHDEPRGFVGVVAHALYTDLFEVGKEDNVERRKKKRSTAPGSSLDDVVKTLKGWGVSVREAVLKRIGSKFPITAANEVLAVAVEKGESSFNNLFSFFTQDDTVVDLGGLCNAVTFEISCRTRDDDWKGTWLVTKENWERGWTLWASAWDDRGYDLVGSAERSAANPSTSAPPSATSASTSATSASTISTTSQAPRQPTDPSPTPSPPATSTCEPDLEVSLSALCPRLNCDCKFTISTVSVSQGPNQDYIVTTSDVRVQNFVNHVERSCLASHVCALAHKTGLNLNPQPDPEQERAIDHFRDCHEQVRSRLLTRHQGNDAYSPPRIHHLSSRRRSTRDQFVQQTPPSSS